jgi:hypothetical protein
MIFYKIVDFDRITFVAAENLVRNTCTCFPEINTVA